LPRSCKRRLSIGIAVQSGWPGLLSAIVALRFTNDNVMAAAPARAVFGLTAEEV